MYISDLKKKEEILSSFSYFFSIVRLFFFFFVEYCTQQVSQKYFSLLIFFWASLVAQAVKRSTYSMGDLGSTDWFQIRKGVRQGCVLSP